MSKYLSATILGLAGFYKSALAGTLGAVLQDFSIGKALATAVGTTEGFTVTNPLACGDFGCALRHVTTFLVFVAAPIATVMVLVGAFTMITAGGDPEKFSKGKKTLLYAAIGFVVILVADRVAPLVQSLFQ